jgi:hypothetical protein
MRKDAIEVVNEIHQFITQIIHRFERTTADHLPHGKNRAVFTTQPVIREGHPILLVTHEEDGHWQILCGTTDRPEEGLAVSLGSMLDHDPTIGELANLPEGWMATCPDDRAPWIREPIPPGDRE